jgi:hypothetical protein
MMLAPVASSGSSNCAVNAVIEVAGQSFCNVCGDTMQGLRIASLSIMMTPSP